MSLTIENLKKTYQQGTEKIAILKGLSAQIQNGEIVAIVGRSGSGKSTLLSLLAGLDSADAGRILLKDQNILGFSESEMTNFRGRNIGIVFQQFHLMNHLTALENVMLPLEILQETDIQTRATEMLTQMNLEHRLNHLPSELSGGECQRVAIARALVVKPAILLADEPSGNLDLETGEKVMNVFFEVVRRNKITTLLVTHSDELAKKCDRELRLQDGVLN
ncbi:MAG: ABC transporter ATP-binding protein [Bdellovibrio sp. CG10_big_fil_rev_8_21_14_0_10_47_8]|nr:MAG: ABC transporter ATP-binding protein [Bdellovibrio sp. CG10_big_fil_rev_8_21_14_0_10_47_8]